MSVTGVPNHSLKRWCRPGIPLHLYNLQLPFNSFEVQFEDGMPILPWNISTKQLSSAKKKLGLALHPDKQRFTSSQHREKSEQAMRLALDAHAILTGDESNARQYMKWCWYWQFFDTRVFGALGEGRSRSICDVRPTELMSYSDWLIESLHLQTGGDQWLSGLGKLFNREWGWGYGYDDFGQSQREWGGPANMRLSFIDQCKEIVVLVPRGSYQRPQSLWDAGIASVKWEISTTLGEVQDFLRFCSPNLILDSVIFHFKFPMLYLIFFLLLRKFFIKIRRGISSLRARYIVDNLDIIIDPLKENEQMKLEMSEAGSHSSSLSTDDSLKQQEKIELGSNEVDDSSSLLSTDDSWKQKEQIELESSEVDSDSSLLFTDDS